FGVTVTRPGQFFHDSGHGPGTGCRASTNATNYLAQLKKRQLADFQSQEVDTQSGTRPLGLGSRKERRRSNSLHFVGDAADQQGIKTKDDGAQRVTPRYSLGRVSR